VKIRQNIDIAKFVSTKKKNKKKLGERYKQILTKTNKHFTKKKKKNNKQKKKHYPHKKQ